MSEREAAMRTPEERLRVLESELAAAQAHNGRLVATLRDAREQIVALKAEVDRILDRINSHGFGALTPAERQILDRARGLLGRSG